MKGYAMLLNKGLEAPKFCILSEADTARLPIGTIVVSPRHGVITKGYEGWYYLMSSTLAGRRLTRHITTYNPFVILSTPKAKYLQTKFRTMELPLTHFNHQELVELEHQAYLLGMHLDMGKTRFSFSWERALRLQDRATVYVGTRDHIMFAYKDGLTFHWPDKDYVVTNQSYYVLQVGN